MRLINDFFRIIETASSDNTYQYKVRFSPEHDLYKVHFPGYPVTPGVCLVQMVAEILEQQLNQRVLLEKAINIKFKKTVGPHEEPTVVFTKMVREDCFLKVVVSIEDRETQFAKMSLQYKLE